MVTHPICESNAANSLEHETGGANSGQTHSTIDLEYLGKLGLTNQLPVWRQAAIKSYKKET